MVLQLQGLKENSSFQSVLLINVRVYIKVKVNCMNERCLVSLHVINILLRNFLYDNTQNLFSYVSGNICVIVKVSVY